MNTDKLKSGWKYGWPWALFMFIWMEVIPMFKEREFDPLLFFGGLLFWIFGGFCIGLWVGHLLRKRSSS